MLTSQTHSSTVSSANRSVHTLDTLAARSSRELDALYRAATVSSSMHAADGKLIGRMLSIRGLPAGIAAPLRRWAAAPSFLWEGKTFQAGSDTRGVGHNRVFVPRALGRQNLFPFETSFGPSAIDGKPTLILDYDLGVNPSFIRKIHDEIREVSPGLFLGPAMWKGERDKALVLWFALGLEAVVSATHDDSKGRAPAHVLITGAAGAIGGALARRMRAAWPAARFALLDRDAGSMTELAGELGNSSVHGVDLRDIDRLPGVVAEIERAANIPIDGLVNCAGVMKVQQLQTWKWDEARDLVAIDLLAPLRLQDLVARGMTERGSGVIVNVASMAGKVPLKGCTYYGASKAGLAMASEIARADLAPFGVRVVTVYPGPVKSQLEQGARDAYGGGGMIGRFAPTGDPDELARRIMKALADDEPRVIYPRLYSVGWSATNLSSWVALSYGPPPVA